MNRPLSSFLSCLLIVLLCFQLVPGQQSSPPVATDEAADAALRDKAFKLLESLSDQLSILQSAENRARIGSNLAESLWTHDEKRARALFQLVEEDIQLWLKRSDDDRESEHTFQVFVKLREDSVERIAKHDPELALAFLRNTFASIVETTRQTNGEVPPGISEREHELELRLAKKLSTRNPDVSVQLARQALEGDLSEDFLLLLIRLSAKNKEQAQILHKEIVAKLRDADFTKDYPVMSLARQLAQHFTPPAADGATYRELMTVFLDKASEHGCEKPRSEEPDQRTSLCVQIAGFAPVIETYYPAQARRLRQWLPEDYLYKTDTFTQSYVEMNDLTANGTVDELLALSTKYPDLEAEIHQRAAQKAWMEGDIERVKKIAASYRGDPSVQQTMNRVLEIVDRSSGKLQEEIDRVTKELDGRPPRHRVEQLLTIARNIALLDRRIALKLLTQAGNIVETLNSDKDKVEAQMALAMVYCLVKDERGLAIMESLMPRLNELIAAAAKLDGYDTRYLRDGEWNMTAAGEVGKLLTILANNAGYFAWYDFDQAVSLAAQFERSEIRMMAQLKLAQGILAGRRKLLSDRAMY